MERREDLGVVDRAAAGMRDGYEVFFLVETAADIPGYRKLIRSSLKTYGATHWREDRHRLMWQTDAVIRPEGSIQFWIDGEPYPFSDTDKLVVSDPRSKRKD